MSYRRTRGDLITIFKILKNKLILDMLSCFLTCQDGKFTRISRKVHKPGTACLSVNCQLPHTIVSQLLELSTQKDNCSSIGRHIQEEVGSTERFLSQGLAQAIQPSILIRLKLKLSYHILHSCHWLKIIGNLFNPIMKHLLNVCPLTTNLSSYQLLSINAQ